MKASNVFDVAVIGCGIAGMATAMRLQAKGYSTVVFESHGQPGGCAGFFRKKGFSFDVGATTLVDFNEEGVGGEFFQSVNLPIPEADVLDYKIWLPDQEICLYQDELKWKEERAEKLGKEENVKAFWMFMDNLSEVFWTASRRGIKLPIQSLSDVFNAVHCIGLKNLYLTKYINWTMEDALVKFNVQDNLPLRNLIAMLIEDTVHSCLSEAPLINSALGITIRRAGLKRVKGGMKGLWDHLISHYKKLDGVLKLGHTVKEISESNNEFRIITSKGEYYSKKLVSAVSSEITTQIAPEKIKSKLKPYILRDGKSLGGAIVVFLGVPEHEVDGQEINHHQLLHNYYKPLGNGNNMFISISSKGDESSAPAGFRAVMLSTHCHLQEWENLSEEEYLEKKKNVGELLVNLARKVYPKLGEQATIYQVGTPRTYFKYTGRPRGAVGGIKQNFENSNFNALPHDIGIKNFRMVGDSTWPGLGTVACILGSRIVAKSFKYRAASIKG